MDLFKIFSLLPKIMAAKSKVENAIRGGVSVNKVFDLIRDAEVQDLFKEAGGLLFPQATEAQAATAVVVSTYSEDYVKKVQRAMNKYVTPSPNLDEDGIYGEKTKAAVKVYQQARGLVVDGWAGQNTMKSIDAEYAKQP